MSECLGVPSNLNLSKNNVALPSSDGAGMTETIQSECAFDEFECDVPDELLASIDERIFAKEEFKVVCNQNESVVNPVFNNCNITFNVGK